MGYQFSLWLHSKHSQAWAALSKPEAKKIAQLSGIREEPQESFTCLGCHSSGAQAEAWQKDETFRVEDGVQCESCHGPGSEYIAEEVMKNREAAMKAGLRMPNEQTCTGGCHIIKGTHVAVLSSPQLDVKKGMAAIAHPAPEKPTMGSIRKTAGDAAAKNEGPKYVGSEACGKCHRGAAFGHQYSLWRMSGHARAWSSLATPRAREAVAKRGLTGDPQALPQCLEKHCRSAWSVTRRLPTQRPAPRSRHSARMKVSAAKRVTLRAATTWLRPSCAIVAPPRPRDCGHRIARRARGVTKMHTAMSSRRA
jgi:hypothetical protein